MIGAGGDQEGFPIVGWLVPLSGQNATERGSSRASTKVGTAPPSDMVVNGLHEHRALQHHVLARGPTLDGGSTNGCYVNDRKVEARTSSITTSWHHARQDELQVPGRLTSRRPCPLECSSELIIVGTVLVLNFVIALRLSRAKSSASGHEDLRQLQARDAAAMDGGNTVLRVRRQSRGSGCPRADGEPDAAADRRTSTIARWPATRSCSPIPACRASTPAFVASRATTDSPTSGSTNSVSTSTGTKFRRRPSSLATSSASATPRRCSNANEVAARSLCCAACSPRADQAR